MLIKKNYQTTKKKKKEKKKRKKEKNQINRKEMVATELILGMEELVNHIRDLEVKIQNFEKNETVREARVQELYEENKKLKEEKQKYQPKGSQIDPEGLHDYMNQQIEDLKEENKKLKEGGVIIDISAMMNDPDYEGFDFESEIKKQKQVYHSNKKMFFEVQEENKKLKEEIIRLEEKGVFMDDYGNLSAEEEMEAEEFLKQNR